MAARIDSLIGLRNLGFFKDTCLVSRSHLLLHTANPLIFLNGCAWHVLLKLQHTNADTGRTRLWHSLIRSHEDNVVEAHDVGFIELLFRSWHIKIISCGSSHAV